MIGSTQLTLGRYAPRDSIIHRLDPRTKMLSLFCLMGLAFFIVGLDMLLAFGLLLCALYPVARISLKLLFGNIRSFFWLLFLTFVLHGFFTEGRVLFSVPLPLYGFDCTLEGLRNGLFYGLRIILLISMANLLTLTTTPMSLTDGLEKLLNPFRKLGLPAHEIAMMMSISMRFIPILLEESERIQKAQMSRGADFDGPLLVKIKSIIPILVPLFVSAFRKANDLALAMDARCYRGGINRSSYQILSFESADYVCFLTVGFLFAAIFLVAWFRY